MVDLCRPSSLPNNQTLGSSDENKPTNNINEEHSRFFPPVILPYSSLLNQDQNDSMTTTVASARVAAPAAASIAEQALLHRERTRVQTKDKKDRSANASVEVKIHLRNFLQEKLQREGKSYPNESNESLRRFQSEPLLQNPSYETNRRKMQSSMRQQLYVHRQKTPLSDERHRMRTNHIPHIHASQNAMSPGPSLAPTPESLSSLRNEYIWPRFNRSQPHSLYPCRSTGSLLENDRKSTSETVDNRPVHTILGPQYFIAEVENEAILAKEFQQAKIQSTHNSRSSIHGSHSQLMPCEIDDHFITKSTLPVDRVSLLSKSLTSLSSHSISNDKKLQRSFSGTIRMRFTTGIAYDEDTLKHECYCKQDELHVENPRRLLAIYEQLKQSRLLDDCEIIRGYYATIEMLTECHNALHANLYGYDQRQREYQNPAIIEQRIDSIGKLLCGGIGMNHDRDTIWNEEYTARACRLAVGNTIELAKNVIDGKLRNGFALVRPPGHHATNTPLAFCYFNNVSITAKFLKKYRNLQRIAIVDWDIHHGNGTQDLTYDDPNILYISMHRYDNGSYFPGFGRISECGCDAGLGKNVNIAFSGEPQSLMTDVEYLAAFRSVVIPILSEFQPQIILVSSGFDGCIGHKHPLGGYELTPICFAYMTRALMGLADGKVVLVLEGGHELNALAACGEACVKALLNRPLRSIPEETLHSIPNQDAIQTLKEVIEVQCKFWPSLRKYEPLISMSYAQACSVDI